MCAPGGKYHGKLKPVLGIEGYVRDDNCEILSKKYDLTLPEYKKNFKYAHITLHAADEQAYFKLVKKLSDADLRAEQHGSERKPLWGWKDLEEICAENVTGSPGCLIGMVGRHLLANNDPQSAIAYYERLRGMFRPGNFYVEVFPHVADRYYQSAVEIVYGNNENVSLKPTRKIKTNAGETYVEDLAKDFKKDAASARKKHGSILDIMENRKWSGKTYPELVSVTEASGFVYNECTPFFTTPDLQKHFNEFVIALARKYKDPIQVGGDAHMAYKEEHALQDVRLDGWRFPDALYRKSGDESFEFLNKTLGVSEALFQEWTENSYAWASKFDNFKFTPKQTLPANFYPKDTLRHTVELIKKKGVLDWSNPAQTARLKEEIELFHKNGTIDLLPYFLMVEEIIGAYVKQGKLSTAGRGSAAGVLLSNALGITSVNPLEYDLSLYRFLSPDRIASGKLPDIDSDFGNRDFLLNGNGFVELTLEDGSKKVIAEDVQVREVGTGALVTVKEATEKGLDVEL